MELRAGDFFYIPPGPPGHDSWVVGDERYVCDHFVTCQVAAFAARASKATGVGAQEFARECC
ncbi:MAG: hypothetical protein ACREM2_01770 [Vulcanimicrobiaceae bacterium]